MLNLFISIYVYFYCSRNTNLNNPITAYWHSNQLISFLRMVYGLNLFMLSTDLISDGSCSAHSFEWKKINAAASLLSESNFRRMTQFYGNFHYCNRSYFNEFEHLNFRITDAALNAYQDEVQYKRTELTEASTMQALKSLNKSNTKFWLKDGLHCVALDMCCGKSFLTTNYPNLFLDIDKITDMYPDIKYKIRMQIASPTPRWDIVNGLHTSALTKYWRDVLEESAGSRILFVHDKHQIAACPFPIIIHGRLGLEMSIRETTFRTRYDNLTSDKAKAEFARLYNLNCITDVQHKLHTTFQGRNLYLMCLINLLRTSNSLDFKYTINKAVTLANTDINANPYEGLEDDDE